MTQNMLRDVPVDIDLLDIKNYAEALSEFIKNCDTPVTIGIQGDWGIGKTSLLNMIVQGLKPARGQTKKFIHVKIETWQYAQFNKEEYIAISVINAINNAIIEKIDDKDKKKELKLVTKKFFKTIFGVANQVVKHSTGADVKDAYEKNQSEDSNSNLEFEDLASEIEKYKKHFVSLVKTVIKKDDGSKLVIMIDDLDRIRPIRALELLEAIKNFLDVERCVFILAIDYSVIEQGMEEKLGKSSKDFYGKSFFDKIIQIPFNMPVASYNSEKYIMAMLGWKKDKVKYIRADNNSAFLAHTSYTTLEQGKVDFFSNVAKLTTNNNPRSIKRLVNYANLLKIICRNNRDGTTWKLEDAQIVFAIASLQLTWQEIFNHFAQNPSPAILKRLEDVDYLKTKIPEAKKLYERVRDPKETRSKISGLFDQLLMLIDKDGDGDISTEEFKPIWSVLTDTNLTNVKLESIKEQWEEFEKIVFKNFGSNNKWTEEKANLLLLSFEGKGSSWGNPLYFRMLSAGNYYKNIIWDQNYIGTIATTKTEVLQLYLNEKTLKVSHNIDDFINSLPENIKEYVTEYTQSHYGTGKIKVDLLKISEIGNQNEINKIMNDLLKSIRLRID